VATVAIAGILLGALALVAATIAIWRRRNAPGIAGAGDASAIVVLVMAVLFTVGAFVLGAVITLNPKSYDADTKKAGIGLITGTLTFWTGFGLGKS
jgi:hypothetical protein